MKRRLTARLTGTVVLTAGTVAALTMPATAAQPQVPESEPQSAKATSMIEAMQRDLGLTLQQAKERLRQETAADHIQQVVQGALGETFGGSHFDAAIGKLVVGVTDRAKFDEVREAGAKARLVDDSLAQLNTTSDILNDSLATAPKSVTGWYVDPTSNSVVVTTAKGTTGKATEFVRSTSADAKAVRIVETANQPRLYADIVGGNRYTIGGRTICSVGFAVQGGFVTAGHCGDQGDSTSGPSGTFAGSSFPGNDYAYVKSSATPKPLVNKYDGSTVTVAGSQEAPVGASVCRSGQTTGWHCGTIEAKNQTVRYQVGTVRGLTRTNVCAEPGDSGGAFISGNQAQGLTSGGSGNCTQGGVTFFQPVNEALQAYGVSLVTG